ncbi:MAG: (Fe-S)-binding protein [Promethearchaeota archaeon]|nr:MAG: (Fe-S)-binding protein [Candidatus Lokiarchaeota archaeon]
MKQINSKFELIGKLNQILKKGQLLTDLEDLYVYSFEKIFLDQIYIKPDIVVRNPSLTEENEIKNLAEKDEIILIERGENIFPPLKNISTPIILLDKVEIPKLESCFDNAIQKDNFLLSSKKFPLSGYGTYRNLASAIQNLFIGKTLSKCQNCTTCSGYCTVNPSFNGVETYSSKGRMLVSRGIMKGDLNISEKVVDIIYNCTKCGLCFAQCFQDLEFHEAILHLRSRIAKSNLVPEIFHTATNNIFEHGDPSAIPASRRLSRVKNYNKLNLPTTAENLCWLGCTVATRTPKTAESLLNILTHINIDYTMLGEEEGCCGYVLISAGLWEEANKVAISAIERIQKTKAKSLITPCSGCYYTFTRLYPEILDVHIPCEILHTSQFLEKLIKNERVNLNPLDINVTYHDPCSLGRHSKVYDAPRNILKSIPNLKLKEMPMNRNCARCCGGGGGLWSYNNNVSLESTQTRLKEDFFPLDVNILATACPQCQLNFRFASRIKNFANRSLKICDITELFELSMECK